MVKKVSDLQRDSEAKATTEVRLYNPDIEDFSVTYHGTKMLSIPALEIKAFPYYEAKHVKKHLADRLLHKRTLPITVKRV